MTNFKDLAQLRRSHRKFTDEEIDAEDVRLIMRAALMSPTSKGQRAWLAVVVLGDPVQNDCWVEDGAIAAISMQYQAEELGLGSCWVQMRGRGLSDGTTADTVIRGILDIPENLCVLCVVAIGHKADERKPQNEDKLKWENVHIGKY